MKLILKKSSIEFRQSYPPGTEIQITPVYSGNYAIGNGYYITLDGIITHLSAYENTETAVSDLIPVTGYSKIKVSNVIDNSYHAVLAFFTNESQTQGTNQLVWSDSSSIEINIPEGSLYIRVGNNTNGGGSQNIGPLVLKLVV